MRGQKHIYLVTMDAGGFAKFTVSQRSVDTASVVLGPDGTQVAESDCFEYGEDSLTLRIERAGVYQLEVRSVQHSSAPGTYSLNFIRSGQADRIPAEQLSTLSKRLREEGTTDSLRHAMEKNGESLERWRSLGDRSAELRTLLQMGDTLYALDRSKEALQFYDLALPISRDLSDIRSEGEVWNGRGSAWWQLERPDLALPYFEKALAALAASKDRSAEAAANSNAAVLYWFTGRWADAARCGRRALHFTRLLGDQRGEAFALNNLAAVAESQGEYGRARDYLNSALRLFGLVHDRNAYARAMLIKGRVQTAINNNPAAIECYRVALAAMTSLGDAQWGVRAMSGLGRIYGQGGDYRRALDSLMQAQTQARQGGYRREEAEALEITGETQTAMGLLSSAAESLLAALKIRRELGTPDAEAETLYHLARNESASRNNAGAIGYARNAILISESLRASALGELSRATYIASKRELYAFYIDLLASEGRPEEAFETCERARARSLLDLLSMHPNGVRRGIPPALLERERALSEQLKFESRRLLQFIDGKQVEERERERRSIDSVASEYDEVEGQIRSGNPLYAALASPQPFQVHEIQAEALDDNTVLLEYFLAKERSYVWVVSKHSLKEFTLPPGTRIDQTARRLYGLLRTRPASAQTGAAARIETSVAALSRMLLAPLARELTGNKTILVAADGAMQLIPFTVLTVSGAAQPLIVSHAIVNLPSASTLVLLRRQTAGRARPPGTLAVLADPVFERADGRVHAALTARGASIPPELAGLPLPRLIFSRREAEAISAGVPPRLLLKALDFKASKATATGPELSGYRFVHLATHAVINSSQPELSGLVFTMVSALGESLDGFLPLHEIYNLSLPADLVTVSGCETGVGVDIRGEGLIGLTRGFIYAGAERVAVSLWAVDDESTAELMKRFYAGFLGPAHMSITAALRSAQLSLLHDARWSQPYAWAAFILQGEYR